MLIKESLLVNNKIGVINKCVLEWKKTKAETENKYNNRERNLIKTFDSKEQTATIEYQNEKKKNEEYLKSKVSTISKKTKVLNDYLTLLPKSKRDKGEISNQIIDREPDLNKLENLSRMLLDETLWAKIKTLIQIGGYYSYKEMMSDYLREIETGKRYYRKVENRIKNKVDTISKSITNDYKEKLKIIKSEKNKEINNLVEGKRRELEKIDTTYYKKLTSEHGTELYNAIGATYKTIGIENIRVNQFNKASYKGEALYVGDFVESLGLPEDLLEKYRSRFNNSINMNKPLIKYPAAINTNKAFLMQVAYGEKTKKTAINIIQGIAFRYMASFPKNEVSVSFFDPKDKGSNLGALSALCKSEGCSLIELPASSIEDISAKIHALDKVVEEISIKTANYDGNIYDYNNSNRDKIKHNVIVIYDFPNNFDRKAVACLESILRNAQKCGISIILGVNEDEINNQDAQSLIDYTCTYGITINVESNNTTLLSDGLNLELKPATIANINVKAITDMVNWYNEKIIVENRIAKCITRVDKGVVCDASKALSIPFAVNERNELEEIEFGGDLSSFMLISGIAGSGKSSLLHSIIAGITINYSPDDVELWLVDYNLVEFDIYSRKKLPHVKLIGLDDSTDFMYGLLDKLSEIIKERQNIFTNMKVASLRQHNRIEGVKKIPRIILIVDELHRMAQVLENDSYYKKVLENIVSEGRKFGISCIFADQDISAGLKGLTPKTKDQFNCRMALKNKTVEGIKATLELPREYYDREDFVAHTDNMEPGEIVIRKKIKNKHGMDIVAVDFTRSIFVDPNNPSSDDMALIQNRVEAKFGQSSKEPEVFYRDRERPVFDRKLVECVLNHTTPNGEYKMVLGTPNNLKPYFEVSLSKRLAQNILTVVPNLELRFSLIWYIVWCLKEKNGHEITMYVNPREIIYREFEEYFKYFKENGVSVLTDLGEICEHINKTKNNIDAFNDSNELIICIGMELFFAKMAKSSHSTYEKWKDNKSIVKEDSAEPSIFDNLINSIANKLDDAGVESKPTNDIRNVAITTEKDNFYNARNDFDDIVSEGAALGYRVLMVLESSKELKKSKIKREDFDHLFMSQMSISDIHELSLYKHGETISNLTQSMICYNDGGLRVNIFSPYLLPSVKSLNFDGENIKDMTE